MAFPSSRTRTLGAALITSLLTMPSALGGTEHAFNSVVALVQKDKQDKKSKDEKKDQKNKKDKKTQPATEQPSASDPAVSLISLGALAYASGYYSQAEPNFRRAFELREKALGPEHPSVAEALNYLGLVYSALGDYTKAERDYSRALQIREKALGRDHKDVAVSLNNLAALYDDKGDYTRAEPLYLRALSIWEKVLGPSDSYVAKALNSLAALYHRKGDYEKAEPLYLRALAIQEKALGPGATEVATILSNMGVFYDNQGNYAKAEPLFLRALAIYETKRTANHPDIAGVLNNLAWLYRAKGDYTKSESTYLRAIEMKQKSLGVDHPGVADAINPLAALYDARGSYQMAEPLYLRALSIREKSLGPEHPDVARSLNNLAWLYEATGDTARAIQYRTRCNEVRERNIAMNLTAGSERQKLLYLATLAGETNATVSLHVKSAPADASASELALTTILRRKGRALDAMTDSIGTLRQRLNADDRALLDRYTSARSQLATLTLRGPGNKKPADYQVETKGLEDQVEKLEADISRRSAEFRAQSQPVTLEAVQAAIPPGAALVEFLAYRPVNLKYEKMEERFGEPRYVVYVLPSRGRAGWVDLGEAKETDAAIDAWRTALRDPSRADVRTLARALDQKVMQPVRKLLGATRQVLLSPDGALNLVPFGALVDEQNRYLVRQFSFTYLSTGRDLLRFKTPAENKQSAVIVADPDFGGDATRAAARGLKIAQGAGIASAQAVEFSQIVFSPLPGTAQEAQTLQAMLTGATVLTKGQATESAIKQLSGPRILHIATHGFFLNDLASSSSSVGRALSVKGAPDVAPWLRVKNPLLRAGLGLAGANLRTGGDEDGILTALEAAGLDLWGTRLVVLSACDTGVGEVKNGEGVYGLRRALVLAGSESQVISLWPVSDDGTRALMVEYYKGLLAGRGRSDALRSVQLSMLLSKDRQHPYYWASFIQSGEWANLNGKR